MADVIKKAGYEAIWAAVRKLGSFTRDDLCVELGKEFGNRVNEHTVKSYLQRLTRAGRLSVKEESIGNGTARIHHYTLIKDTGVVAPRLNDAGQPTRLGTRQAAIWRTIRILKRFTWSEIVTAGSTDEVPLNPISVQEYISHLVAAGYLICSRHGCRQNGPAEYRLLPDRNTGPKPPKVSHTRTVYDQNLDQVVYTQPAEVEV